MTSTIPLHQQFDSISNTCTEERYSCKEKGSSSVEQNWNASNELIIPSNTNRYKTNSGNRNVNDNEMGKISKKINCLMNDDITKLNIVQEDSPGVARARRLLSTMKDQREYAYQQLRKSSCTTNIESTKTLVQCKESKNSTNTSTTKNKKDSSYYDTINQELRTRIQQKIESQNSKVSKIDDNNTVSTAQSTTCKTISSSMSLSSTTCSLSTSSQHWSQRPICYPLHDSLLVHNSTNNDELLFSTTTTTSRTKNTDSQRNETTTIAIDDMVTELTSFLAKCNLDKSKQQTCNVDDNHVQDKKSKENKKTHSTPSSSSPERSRRFSNPSIRHQRSSTVKNQSKLIQYEQQKQSPKRCQSEHSRIGFRKVQSFDTSCTSSPVFRNKSRRIRNSWRGQRTVSKSNILFHSASADDAATTGINSNDDSNDSIQFSSNMKPINLHKSTYLEENDNSQSCCTKKNLHSVTIATVLSGASTASVTTSCSSDTNKNNVISIPHQHKCNNNPQTSSSIPRLVHSYHDRRSQRTDIAAVSPLSTYRSNSLSPKRKRNNSRSKIVVSNRHTMSLSLNDIGTPYLLHPNKAIQTTISPTVTTATAKTIPPTMPYRCNELNSSYSTDMFLKQARNKVEEVDDMLDTPESRQSFIRELYRSNTNLVDTTPNKKNSFVPKEKLSSLYYQRDSIRVASPQRSTIASCTDTKGVKSFINAFQAINTAIKQDIDAPTRIRTEYQMQRKHQHQTKQLGDQTSNEFRLPSDTINKKKDDNSKNMYTKVELKPSSILVGTYESIDDDNETATLDATLDVTLDEDVVSDYSNSSDTSGWISNSSKSLTLDYDSDIVRPPKSISSKIVTLSLVPGSAKKTTIETRKKKKKNDKKKEQQTADLNNSAAVATTPSFSQHCIDENCGDSVSLLSTDRIEEQKSLVLAVDITPPSQKKVPSDSIHFSPFEEVKWTHSPRKRVCFAPDTVLANLVYYYPPEELTITEDDEDEVRSTVVAVRPQIPSLFVSEEVSNEYCSARGGLYDLTLSRCPPVEGQTCEIHSIHVRRGHAKLTVVKLSTDFRCGTYGSHFDIALRSGCNVIHNTPLQNGNKKDRGNNSRSASTAGSQKENITNGIGGLLPVSGGLYDLALKSGLTKEILHSRQPYRISVNLQNSPSVGMRTGSEFDGVVKEIISDERCGATGSWYHLATSRTRIPKRKPLEPDIHWVS